MRELKKQVDTRQNSFECENPDENLRCDLGIDLAG